MSKTVTGLYMVTDPYILEATRGKADHYTVS